MTQFLNEYKANPYAGDSKYSGKIIQLTGTIVNLLTDEGRLYTKMNSYDYKKKTPRDFTIVFTEDVYDDPTFSLWFNSSDLPREKFLNLRKGQQITVLGRLTEFTYEGKWKYFYQPPDITIMGLDECRLVK